jgi:hypothetical protein
LNISIAEDGKVDITGYCYDISGGFNEFNLSGTVDSKKFFSGVGIVNFGAFGTIVEELRGLFSVKWRMFPEDMKVEEQPDLLDIKLTRSITLPPPSPQPSLEEVLAQSEFQKRVHQNYPPINQQQIREAKFSYNCELEKRFGDSDRRKKMLYARDKILTDIDWSEIGDFIHLPDIFFAIDHISTIEDKKITDYLLQTFREEGIVALQHDWKSWAKIPLLFLFVYYDDWLTPERVEELSKLSNRLRLIIEEVKKKGKDAPNKLDEIMVTVLSKLSERERRDYFVKSLRLRDYVRSSTNISLQKLMPNDLPPPPGPPANMRDWTCQNGEVYHGAFLRMEKEERPFKDRRVIILDVDRFEIRFSVDFLTLPDQRYLTEMLEAMKEDAAEKNNNTTQENNDTKK